MPITPIENSGAAGIPLSSFISVKPRFLRSVNLERDFYTEDPLESYIITSSALATLERLSSGIEQPHARACSITGPYGTGKSAFALFAARSLAPGALGSAPLRDRVEREEPSVATRVFPANPKGFWPILITGARMPLARSLVEGLLRGLKRYPKDLGQEVAEDLRRQAGSVLASEQPSPDEVAQVFELGAACARRLDPNCLGLFVVVDELGKYLEYAALHPEQSDIHVLQALGEFVARTRENAVILAVILHQAFEEYAHRLSSVQRTEWQKVQGRFFDLPFGDSPDESVNLIAHAIEHCVERVAEPIICDRATQQLQSCKELGIIPSGFTAGSFGDTLVQTYPLHPLVLRVLPYVFKRFGQNERSLFSFLSSDEPFGFQEFLNGAVLRTDEVPVLDLADLYDYMVSAFGSSLYSHPTAKLWSETEEAVLRLRERDSLQIRLVKTIGILQIVGEQTRVSASRKTLAFALSSDTLALAKIEEALKALEVGTLVTYRQFRQSYRLYEGSDIDVDSRLREARAFLGSAVDTVKVAQRLGMTQPVVARRHSYETGTFRYFEVRYTRATDLEHEISTGHAESDGLLLVCLATDATELADAEDRLAHVLPTHPEVIVGVAVETEALREAAVLVECLQTVLANTPELRSDRVAMREVRERLVDATAALKAEWDRLLRPQAAHQQANWYHQGNRVHLTSYRQLQNLVSEACNVAYSQTPRILNELVNRRQLSSTAAAARRNLLEAMVQKRTVEKLGIEGYPPEASIYSSVLRETGIHRLGQDGKWALSPPSTELDSGLMAVWESIEDFLFGGFLEPRPLEELNSRLKARPFGLSDGLIPLIVFAALLHHEHEVAIYEDGRFVTEWDIAAFERMAKRPQDFNVQGCRIAGERQRVLERFGRGLLRNEEEVTLVNIVRQLFRIYHRLPEYTTRTRRLDGQVMAVLDLFKESREPEQFLFVDLPKRLGAKPFVEAETDADNVETFFAAWNATMLAILGAYPALLGRIEDQICGSFDVSSWSELRTRATDVEPHIGEQRLKGFVSRASDASLAREKWIESVAQVVVGRPSYLWGDTEEERFGTLLQPLVSAFRHGELLLFEKLQAREVDQTALRVSVALDTGEEDARVVFVRAGERETVSDLSRQLRGAFEAILASTPRDIQLAVIAQVAQDLLRGNNDGTRD